MTYKYTPLPIEEKSGLSIRTSLILFAAGLLVCLATSTIQRSPGYMDAEYYMTGGLRTALGLGGTEPYLWNYLNPVSGLPAPAFTYWMPLTSLLSAIIPILFKVNSFWAARLPFILFTGLIPPMTAWISWELFHSRKVSLLAGFLAVFPGMYLPYLGTVDTFPVYILLGGIFIQIVKYFQNPSRYKVLAACFLAGLVGGGMHLARADGIIVVIVAGVLFTFWQRRGEDGEPISIQSQPGYWLAGMGCIAAAYLVVMGPWYWRNLNLYGSFFPPGSRLTLWLTNYDEMFSYPPTGLTVQHWLDSGLGSILKVRLDALLINLQTFFVIQGGIILWPLSFLGFWPLRGDIRIAAMGLIELAIFIAMTVFFPLAGSRGGFFHSGAAVQAFLWATAPAGLLQCIQLGKRLRGWDLVTAWRVFSMGLLTLCILISVLFTYRRVIGSDLSHPAWNESGRINRELGQALEQQGIDSKEVVMVNNPPGFFLATGRPAVVIPTNGETAVRAAARRYHASILLLDADNATMLESLYGTPGDREGFRYLGTVIDNRLYRLDDQ
ncbi:MAG TPA: hypothetical protein VMT46_07830 [Anaerolineaceae bacterium]|nr:hypothetical protein [Anaerolineaceae bacterium]